MIIKIFKVGKNRCKISARFEAIIMITPQHAALSACIVNKCMVLKMLGGFVVIELEKEVDKVIDNGSVSSKYSHDNKSHGIYVEGSSTLSVSSLASGCNDNDILNCALCVAAFAQ